MFTTRQGTPEEMEAMEGVEGAAGMLEGAVMHSLPMEI